MSTVNLVLDEVDILGNISASQVARYYVDELLENFHHSTLIEYAGGIEEIIGDASDDLIDAEFHARHPNPSEMLDHLDDEAIIDYLINKGYNIEM